MDLFNLSGAIFSECKTYRYALWRKWDLEKSMVLFIMLNPSKADEYKDDPTIRRCKKLAHGWGYGGMYVGNLYAFRATDPILLQTAENPEGPDNQKHLKKLSLKSSKIICAWGNKQGWPSRIIDNFENLHYLELAKDNSPKHPLYLKKTVIPHRLVVFLLVR